MRFLIRVLISSFVLSCCSIDVVCSPVPTHSCVQWNQRQCYGCHVNRAKRASNVKWTPTTKHWKRIFSLHYYSFSRPFSFLFSFSSNHFQVFISLPTPMGVVRLHGTVKIIGLNERDLIYLLFEFISEKHNYQAQWIVIYKAPLFHGTLTSFHTKMRVQEREENNEQQWAYFVHRP